MKDILYIALITCGCILFTIQTVEMENKIFNLQDELEYNIQANDSLDIVIDSLTKKLNNTIWDFDIQFNGKSLLSSIMYVESSYNDSAYNSREDAVGCLQIRRTMVDDVNRILKRQGKTTRYTYNDRWVRYKSIEMFKIYCKHYGLDSAEEIARCWNGGPRGSNNPATVGYWNKVKNKMGINS